MVLSSHFVQSPVVNTNPPSCNCSGWEQFIFLIYHHRSPSFLRHHLDRAHPGTVRTVIVTVPGGGAFWPSASPLRGNPSLRRRDPFCPDSHFPYFCDFSQKKSSKTQTKTWDSLTKTSKYHPKPTMSKTHGWIRVFLTQISFRKI